MDRVIFERTPFERKRILIRAWRDDVRVGSLDYLPVPSSSKRAIELGFLSVPDPRERGKGLGKMLLQEFVGDVGAGRKIRAVVAHDKTYKTLASQYPNPSAAERTPLLISKPQALQEIPITKILKSGNIEVYRIWVVYNSQQVSSGPEIENFPELKIRLPIYRIIVRGITQ